MTTTTLHRFSPATLISVVTAVLVTGLAIASFILSFDALTALAISAGFSPRLAPLWALSVDAFIIVASLAVLRGQLYTESTRYAWFLVAVFTLASIAFNALYGRPDLLEQWSNWLSPLAHALPPLALFLSFELLIKTIRAEVNRRAVTQSLGHLQAQEMALSDTLAELQGQNDRLDAAILAKKDSLKQMQSEVKMAANGPKSKNAPANDRQTDRQTDRFTPGDEMALDRANKTRLSRVGQRRTEILSALSEGQIEPDPKQVAHTWDISIRTARRDLKALNGQIAEVTG